MTDAENIEKAADRSLDKQELLQLSTEGDPDAGSGEGCEKKTSSRPNECIYS